MRKRYIFLIVGIILVVVATGITGIITVMNHPFRIEKNTYLYIDADDNTDSICHKLTTQLQASSLKGFKLLTTGVKRALVVCDMPFGTYQVDATDGVRNAIRIMQETGCDALKLEGGVEILPTVTAILEAGIPVMGHLGLTPQSINKFGTYAVRAL